MNPKGIILLLLATLVAVATPGCDSTIITPFSGRDVHYSIYGYLMPSDTHLVRVVPIRNKLSRDDVPVSLDAQVNSHELRSGRQDSWSQVLPFLDDGNRGLQFSDSTYGHVFQAIFSINPGEEYELSISDVTGDATTVVTTVPEVKPPIPGDFSTEGGRVIQELHIPDLYRQPFRVESTYFLVSPIFNSDRHGFVISSENRGTVDEDGITVRLNLSEELSEMRRIIRENLPRYSDLPVLEDPANFPIGFSERSIRVFAGDSAWQHLTPDPDLPTLSQPGAISNVENGFGFFGALGIGFTEASSIPDQFRQQAGYAN